MVVRQHHLNNLFSACQRTIFYVFYFSLCSLKSDDNDRQHHGYRKLSSACFSFPTISLSSHFSCRVLKIIKLSLSSSIISMASCFNSSNLTSEISPSNTEF